MLAFAETMTELLRKLTEIAREAGTIILSYYAKTHLEVQTKDDKTPLTMADMASHDHIVTRLKQEFENIPIISEEGEIPSLEKRKDWKEFFLVDPLDGTKEFIKKTDEFTVNIALLRDGVPVAGVIFAPAKDLLYYAQEGQGSWKVAKDGHPVRIYSTETPPDQLRVVHSRSHLSDSTKKFMEDLGVVHGVGMGSSLKFCILAEGGADIYPRLSPTMEWDVAAGDCIYRNSGKSATRKSPLVYNTKTLKINSFVLGVDRPR